MDSLSALSNQTIVSSTLTSATQTTTAADEASENAEQQKVDFLQLLLTQIENQNPLDPMDTDEYAAQLTRYSQLEQQIETNEQLSVISSWIESNTNNIGFSYMGQDVEIDTNASVAQNGEAVWSYSVDGDASSVTLTVYDESGSVVAETTGDTSSGAHSFTLDTSSLGIEDSEQLYLSVNATDSSSNHLNTEITAHVTVDGLWSDEDQTYLSAGEISFLTTDILKVLSGTTASASV